MAMNPDSIDQQTFAHGLPRSVEHGKGVNILFTLLAAVALVEVLAFQAWGPVALTLTALVLVPLMFVFFISISWPGKSRRKG